VNRNAPFVRKIIYATSIVVLLVPLFWLGQPATRDNDGTTVQGGGRLALLRVEHRLSQAQLGNIDPTSESMRLATVGLRGPAASFLWHKALVYQRKKNWDALSATVNQIIKLQPNFIGIWEFQSHNLSYNISADFDDYRHRYHWVKKGIDFLCLGNKYNRDEPRLLHYTGWFIGHKLGNADEKVEFRKMFRDDNDYHALLRDEMEIFDQDMDSRDAQSRDQKYDNWLVSRLWYLQAVRAVDYLGRSLRGKSPLIFHSDPAKSRINYADAIEEEGQFGEVAQNAWERAGIEWQAFSARPIPSSWGTMLRLNAIEEANKRLRELRDDLKSLSPDLEAQIVDERTRRLSADRLVIWETLEEDRQAFTFEDWNAYYMIQRELYVTNGDLARRSPKKARDQAQQVLRRINRQMQRVSRVDGYRRTVNFDYWETRCRVEQSAEATKAREHGFLAMEHYDEARLELAKEEFENGWREWLKVLGQFPEMKSHETRTELDMTMKAYKQTLVHLGEDPPKFMSPLKWLDTDDYIDPNRYSLEQQAIGSPEGTGKSKDKTPPVEDKTPPAK